MAHSIPAAGPSSLRGSSTGEQRMDKELSDSRSAVETVSQLSRLEPSPGLTWFTHVSARRRPWPSKPSQRKLSTFDAKKGRLDGLCLTDSAEEQLKDEKLSDFGSLSQTASEMNQPDVSVRQRQWTYKLPKTPSLKRLITDDSVSEHGSTSFLYPPSPRRISYQCFQMWPPATVEHYSSGNSLPPYSVNQGPSDSFTRRLVDNPSSLSQPTTSAKNKTFTGADQSPNIPFINSSEEFTSDVTADSSLSKEAFNIASGHLLYQPPPGTLTETRAIKRNVFAAGGTPGFKQHDARDMDLNATAGPSTLHLFTSPSEDDVFEVFPFPCIGQNSRVSSEGSRAQDIYEVLSEQSEAELQLDVGGPLSLVNCSRTNALPVHPRLQMFSLDPRWSRRDSSCLPRSRSMPSLSQIISTKICTGASSLPDILSKSNFNEYTPDITDDENDETFSFQCSGPGLYQCSVTGLVFHMEGEGVVVYRTVPWNRRLLALHHKRPAGPLFDISCVQQSVCRLHLPHCEIRSTGGGGFLSVAHVTDEGIEFISPHEITETHVIINITGFSDFGNVSDEDSPAVPVRALVLLFYQPPADPDPTSLLNVLLLPRNVVLRDVLRVRKKLVGDEVYIETSPHCKLQPNQDYTLSTCPEDDSILVQPTEAEFDCDNYDNYFPSFQVRLKIILTDIKLLLRDTDSSHIVWERRVCLSSARGQRISLNLPPPKRLLDIRSSFIDSISGPVLKSLLDKLFHSKVIADPERESAHEMQNNRDKARFVIDTVRKKGEDASSKMIEFLCEADPFLCEHLGLI